MSVKLYKFNKNLDPINEVDIPMEFAQTMTISHFTDVAVSTSEVIPFTFKSFGQSTPILNEEEYVIVIREKINLSDNTSKEITTQNNGNIKGKAGYSNKSPYNHPNGVSVFTELRGNR